jgi:hypothetical protein
MTARRLTKAGAAYERTTSFHEAAHACAAIALRIPFAKVIINVGQALPGGRMCYDKAHLKFWRLLQDGHRKDPAVIDYVHRRLVVAFAGAAAQRRYAPSSNWYGDTDWEAANTWLQYLLVGPPEPEEGEDFYDDATGDYYGDVRELPLRLLVDRKTLGAYHAEFTGRAAVLVKKLFPEIKIVAAQLLKRKVLTQSQVRRLMNRARR